MELLHIAFFRGGNLFLKVKIRKSPRRHTRVVHQYVKIIARDRAGESDHICSFFTRRKNLRDGALLVVGERGPMQEYEVTIGPKPIRHEVVFNPLKNGVPNLFGVA